jgi:hypothetical protein
MQTSPGKSTGSSESCHSFVGWGGKVSEANYGTDATANYPLIPEITALRLLSFWTIPTMMSGVSSSHVKALQGLLLAPDTIVCSRTYILCTFGGMGWSRSSV